MAEFPTIPKNLHKSYIDKALGRESNAGYKYWSFKTKSVFANPKIGYMSTSKNGSKIYIQRKNENGENDNDPEFDAKLKTSYAEKLKSDPKSKKHFREIEETKLLAEINEKKSKRGVRTISRINSKKDRALLEQRTNEAIDIEAANTIENGGAIYNKDLFINAMEDTPYSRLTVDSAYYPFSDTFFDFIKGMYYGKTQNSQFSEFLNNIPTITIRGYIPETILGLFVNIGGSVFDFLSDSVSDFTKKVKEDSSKNVDLLESLFNTITDFGKFFETKIKVELSAFKDNPQVYYKRINDNFGNLLTGGLYGINKIDENYDNLFIKIPYFLYYKILRAKTNNIYEFPAIVNNIFKSNSYGWSSGHQANLGSLTDGILGYIGNTIGTTYTPIFDPRQSSDEQIGFTITLDLINDTLEHAKQNYDFVHSLVLYNMWVQYGVGLQGPGSLYDVKISGGQRFLMCTGNFTVTNKGLLRKVQGNAESWNPWKEELRIPDVYSLQLEFKSLLPNNLNNYMISMSTDNFMVKPGSFEKGSQELMDANEVYTKQSTNIESNDEIGTSTNTENNEGESSDSEESSSSDESGDESGGNAKKYTDVLTSNGGKWKLDKTEIPGFGIISGTVKFNKDGKTAKATGKKGLVSLSAPGDYTIDDDGNFTLNVSSIIGNTSLSGTMKKIDDDTMEINSNDTIVTIKRDK